MGLVIAFWLLSGMALIGALGVVVIRNVFRAALSLVLCFVAIAGLYVTLSADFLAAIQILVYIGAVSVLIILAVMMTRDVQHGSPSNKLVVPAIVMAAVFFGAMIYAVLNTPWVISTVAPTTPTTAGLADGLLGANGYILPVEISAVLLLSAVIGSIVIAREK
ncbi:NADH-quinone oxidoreductase subunit J [Chloroflexota bacterium]